MLALHERDCPPASMPKGCSAVTADSIREALRSFGEAMTAQAIAESIAVPRARAQRHLGDLARAARVELTLRYGTTGRAEHRFLWLGTVGE